MPKATGSRAKAVVIESVKRPLRRIRSDYRELTAPFRGLPSALVIGAQRSGTTSIFNYLIQHPDVVAPLGKEIHYFDLHYDQGVRFYRGRFPYSHRLRNGAITLDATPYYLVHPLAPERAAGLLPDIKLIALLRNPIERAFSHYQHEVRGGTASGVLSWRACWVENGRATRRHRNCSPRRRESFPVASTVPCAHSSRWAARRSSSIARAARASSTWTGTAISTT